MPNQPVASRAVRFVALGGCSRLFSRPPQPSDGPAHRGQIDVLSTRLLPEVAVLLQGGIDMGGQLESQLGVEGCSRGRGMARNRGASQVPRHLTAFERAVEGGQRYLEGSGHLGAWPDRRHVGCARGDRLNKLSWPSLASGSTFVQTAVDTMLILQLLGSRPAGLSLPLASVRVRSGAALALLYGKQPQFPQYTKLAALLAPLP